MGIVAEVPRDIVAKKPAHGEPCNRCGGCCMATICPLGQKLFKRVLGPCPALSFDGDGSICGLVADPMRFDRVTALRAGVDAARDAAKLLIGSATGCDARLNGEPGSAEFYSRLREWDRVNRGPVNRAKKLWGAL